VSTSGRSLTWSLAASFFALFGMSAVAVAWSPAFRACDSHVSSAVRFEPGWATLIDIFSWVSSLGSTPGIAVVATAVALTSLVLGRWRPAVFVLVTLIPGWLCGRVAKEVVGRARPAGALISLPGDPSFPSGHALASFLLYGSLAVLALLHVRGRRERWLLAGSAVAIVVVVGLSRVVLGVHFAGDVLGSWLLGGAWLAVTSSVYAVQRRPGADADGAG